MKNKIIKTLLACAFIGITATSLTACGKNDYKLLWEDNFDGTTLNDSIWNREVRDRLWTNNELQSYTSSEENGFLRDGKFVIKAIQQFNEDGTPKLAYDNPSDGTDPTLQPVYTSCKLNTHLKADFTYGKIEVSAKVPEGQGLWPAIWMMPEQESNYGSWPTCGEIDIMEVLGDNVKKSYGTVHYGTPHAEQQGYVELTEGSFADSFHKYSIEWEPDHITWYIDDVEFLTVTDWFSKPNAGNEYTFPAPFNQKFGIQINLAVGGNWPGHPAADASYMNNAEFEIDYVRVSQRGKYNTNVKKPEKEFRSPAADGNYINNCDFSNAAEDLTDEKDWQFKQNANGVGSCTLENGVAVIKTTLTGEEDYSIQFLHHEMPFFKGKTYVITFDMWADEDRTVAEVCVDAPNAGWSRYWTTKSGATFLGLPITTERTTYTFEFTMKEKDDNAARFEFNMGKNPDSTATIYIANVSVKEKAE